MNPIEQYIHDRDKQVQANISDRDLRMATRNYTEHLVRTNYTKNYTWMGVPVLQYPGDLMVMQELIWKVKPDYIVEIGTAFGGLTVFCASVLQSIRRKGKVVAVDIEFRQHTIDLFLTHPQITRIIPIEGNSVLEETESKIREVIWKGRTLFILDSNHTHDHVLQELRLYSPLVSVGSYIVAFDTAIEEFGYLDKNQDRPWGKGNNPATAVKEFMKGNEEFVVDREVEQRAGITAAVGGWLKRVKEVK